MGLSGFERRLENMVEGVFARVFRSGLRPIELGRRIAREMDTNRTIDVRGHTLVPNAFVVSLSAADHERFAEAGDALARELCEAARDHAREEGYSFMGPVDVVLEVEPKLRAGEFRITSAIKAGTGGAGAGSLLLPTGDRYLLGGGTVTLGRSADCDITIADSNVSRHHAEIRPAAEGFVLVDLGSTNGTRVNGVRVGEHRLEEGDELLFGGTRLVFQAS